MNIFSKVRGSFLINKYKFWHWFFQWNQDDDSDITFSVAGVVHFTKYKEHTVIRFGRKNYERAPKYVQCKESD